MHALIAARRLHNRRIDTPAVCRLSAKIGDVKVASVPSRTGGARRVSAYAFGGVAPWARLVAHAFFAARER